MALSFQGYSGVQNPCEPILPAKRCSPIGGGGQRLPRRLPCKEVRHTLRRCHKAAAATSRRLSLKLQQSKRIGKGHDTGLAVVRGCPVHTIAAAAAPSLSLKLQQSKHVDTGASSGVFLAVACSMHGKQLLRTCSLAKSQPGLHLTTTPTPASQDLLHMCTP